MASSLWLVLASFLLISSSFAISWKQTVQSSTARPVGVIKSVNGNSVILTTDSGSEINVLLQDSTRLLRTAPGQKDLSGATAIKSQDLQAGDRMLVRGTNSEDGKSVLASSVIVVSRSDITQKQEHDRQDWQKRGVGGLVQSVDTKSGDPAEGKIIISLTTFSGTKTITIQTSKGTIIRRYSPDSVKFDDAKPGTLDQIKPGDQLRARGTRNADGTELGAEEIVSGSFRNIAGTVESTDPGKNTISVMDLLKKKPVTVKLSGDSQLRNLPPFVAQRLAARLTGAGASAGGGPPAGAGSPPARDNTNPPRSSREGASQAGGGMRSGPPDFQQMLNRMPAVNLADLHKGDTVMIVATEGTASSEPTIITLLTGVDAILSASPNGRAASILSPWNLGSGGIDAGTP
ncbi:MAG TPA: DUF5666 domain-containing protein [Terriglobales bacterium]|nr:DUF5666 domain-containing protein [Terriglobales bacterium]